MESLDPASNPSRQPSSIHHPDQEKEPYCEVKVSGDDDATAPLSRKILVSSFSSSNEVGDGEAAASLSMLKEVIAASDILPVTSVPSSSICLQYRDKGGDLVEVRSNEELSEALNNPSDGTSLKLELTAPSSDEAVEKGATSDSATFDTLKSAPEALPPPLPPSEELCDLEAKALKACQTELECKTLVFELKACLEQVADKVVAHYHENDPTVAASAWVRQLNGLLSRLVLTAETAEQTARDVKEKAQRQCVLVELTGTMTDLSQEVVLVDNKDDDDPAATTEATTASTALHTRVLQSELQQSMMTSLQQEREHLQEAQATLALRAELQKADVASHLLAVEQFVLTDTPKREANNGESATMALQSTVLECLQRCLTRVAGEIATTSSGGGDAVVVFVDEAVLRRIADGIQEAAQLQSVIEDLNNFSAAFW